MKKRISTFLLALLAALTLTVPAWAETQPGDALIYDTESLLTDGERQQLESLADQITWQYDCAVYVVTIYDYEQYADGVYEAACTIYNDYDFGIGEDRDGVLLLLSMYDRSYSLYVRDGYAQSMIGSYAQQQLEDSFLDYLGDDDWYGGFHAYLTTCADMMQQASEGHAVRKPLGKVIFPAPLGGGAAGAGPTALPMLNLAGLGIAFHAKPKVKATARQSISTIGLDGILYFLGLKDSRIEQ